MRKDALIQCLAKYYANLNGAEPNQQILLLQAFVEAQTHLDNDEEIYFEDFYSHLTPLQKSIIIGKTIFLS